MSLNVLSLIILASLLKRLKFPKFRSYADKLIEPYANKNSKQIKASQWLVAPLLSNNILYNSHILS